MSGGKSSEQTVGYKYHAGVDFTLCYGPIDKIIDMRVADRQAWIGEEAGSPTGYGQITVNKPELFGGDGREGGVAGTIDVGMGYPTQPVNSYLADKIGSTNQVASSSGGDGLLSLVAGAIEAGQETPVISGSELVPAYRGVVSLIARQFYWGNNPYLKAADWLVQRIHTRSDGSQQWYDERAAIGVRTAGKHAVYIALDTSGSMNTVTANGNTRLENAKVAINNLLDFIATFVDSTDVDIMVVGWDGEKSTLQARAVTRADIETIKAFVNSLSKHVSKTLFELAVEDAAAFFEGTEDYQRTVLFITDGEPYSTGGSGEAVALAQLGADILFSTPNINAYSFNIDLVDTTYTAYMDNTPSDGIPVIDGDNPEQMTNVLKAVFWGYLDMNPAHMIREIMTDPVWGAGLPETEMGDTYTAVADTLFDEGLGLSFHFTDEMPYSEMIDEIMRHIDAVRYEDPETGLQEIKLIRGDYDVATLPHLTRSNSELQYISTPANNELINQVVVKYWDRSTDKDASITLQDTAAINMVGAAPVSQTMEYSGICSDDVALMVGQRDLARFSRPFHTGRIKTNRKIYNLKPGDVFKLTDPEYGIAEMICRVTKRSEAGQMDGTLTLEFGEDVFGQNYNTYTQPAASGWVDPLGNPQPFSAETAFEIPYFLLIKRLGDTAIEQINDTACYYGLAAGRPLVNAHLNYDLYVYPDGTTQEPDTELANKAEFTPLAVVSENVLDPQQTTIPVDVLIDVESMRAGHLVLVGSGLDAEREVIALTAQPVDGDLFLAVTRGVIDTVPQPIFKGTVLFVVSAFYGTSDTEYLPFQTVEAYGTPKNGNGIFEGPYNYHDLEMQGRFSLPYPPANLMLDGEYRLDGTYRPPNSVLQLTWNHRDRVQQSDQIISWFEAADYGPEAGTTYRIESDAYDEDGALITANWLNTNIGLASSYSLDLTATPASTSYLDVRLYAVRGAEDSLQAAAVRLILDGELLITGDDEPLFTTDDNYLVGAY